MNDPEFQKAFDEQDRREQISNATLATVLSIILMPLGMGMDYFVYPGHFVFFLELRLCSSLLVGVGWLLFLTPAGRKYYAVFGVLWYMVPTVFILWMIYAADRPDSPYYAGLNIVLLSMGLLSPATHKRNLWSSALVVVMFATLCCFMHTAQTKAALFNNLYFLSFTALIVVAGSVAHRRLRVREFELRWELDKSRRVVEESNRRLVELGEIKSRFFANISHELRTPLTLLLAPLETLLPRFTRSGDEPVRNMLVTMQANGMRLLKLINDLLDLVRLESGRMEVRREAVDVAGFVKGVASACRQMAEDKKLKFETRVDPQLGWVQVDRDKLEKILLNLVFNALKFTPAGGQVELRAEQQGEQFVLVVADTGKGIAEKQLQFVFDRFWQADDSSKRKYQGVGIGLALVKELAELQGGTVSVASEEGKGATFTVRLPLLRTAAVVDTVPLPEANAPTPAAVPVAVVSDEWLANLYRRAELFPAMVTAQETLQPAGPGTGGKPSLLVADDEPDMLRFLKSQLVEHYRVLEAVDGQQAVDQAAEFLPDIILLDMMMPNKDGLQACAEIRARAATQNIPIIMLTARADEETKLAALGAGASDFLPKPFSITELHVRIKNLVESHHYQQKLAKQNRVLETIIDQLKETESLLVQTEKMVSLGRMSAGIIHEINNPLNYATTGLYSLRNKAKHLAPDHQEEYREILQDVEEGMSRVKTIVSSLKTFTHPDTEQVDEVEVAEMVAFALKFLSKEWKEKVRIEQHVAAALPIRGNRNKLLQVFVNLLQNSLDAVQRKSYAGEQPLISIEGSRQGDELVVLIRDNGEGIEARALDKIFDPFFTTKDVGEGMGLGLSICYRIVQECGGRISVRSEHGKFCEFRLAFPAPAAAANGAPSLN